MSINLHVRELARAAEKSGANLLGRVVATIRADLGVATTLVIAGAVLGFIVAKL